jgi:hypothetical protein
VRRFAAQLRGKRALGRRRPTAGRDPRGPGRGGAVGPGRGDPAPPRGPPWPSRPPGPPEDRLGEPHPKRAPCGGAGRGGPDQQRHRRPAVHIAAHSGKPRRPRPGQAAQAVPLRPGGGGEGTSSLAVGTPSGPACLSTASPWVQTSSISQGGPRRSASASTLPGAFRPPRASRRTLIGLALDPAALTSAHVRQGVLRLLDDPSFNQAAAMNAEIESMPDVSETVAALEAL